MLKSSNIKEARFKKRRDGGGVVRKSISTMRVRDPVQIKSIFPDAAGSCELQKSQLNVARGGVIYERAKSRRERNRSALMRHSCASRDEAVALQRGGARGPGSAVFHKGDKDGVEEQLEQKGRLRMLKIAESMKQQGLHPNNQVLPSERWPQTSKVGKARRSLQRRRPRSTFTGNVKTAPTAKFSKLKAISSKPSMRPSPTDFTPTNTKRPRLSFTATRRPSHEYGSQDRCAHRPELAELKRASESDTTKKPLSSSKTIHQYHASAQVDSQRSVVHQAIYPTNTPHDHRRLQAATSPPSTTPQRAFEKSSDRCSNTVTPPQSGRTIVDLTSDEPAVIDLSID